MSNPILFEVENSIALITLNRPLRRNAINQALLIAERPDYSAGSKTTLSVKT